jgi:hypothetical protein
VYISCIYDPPLSIRPVARGEFSKNKYLINFYNDQRRTRLSFLMRFSGSLKALLVFFRALNNLMPVIAKNMTVPMTTTMYMTPETMMKTLAPNPTPLVMANAHSKPNRTPKITQNTIFSRSKYALIVTFTLANSSCLIRY